MEQWQRPWKEFANADKQLYLIPGSVNQLWRPPTYSRISIEILDFFLIHLNIFVL